MIDDYDKDRKRLAAHLRTLCRGKRMTDRHFIGTPDKEKEDMTAPPPISSSIAIDRDDLIRDLLSRIEQLEKRVAFLEGAMTMTRELLNI